MKNLQNKIQVPESIRNLVREHTIRGLDKAQDEIGNTIAAFNGGQYSRIGVDLSIQHLRSVRDFMKFLKDIDDIPEEEDPDDTITV